MIQDTRRRPEEPMGIHPPSEKPSLSFRRECWRRLWSILLAEPPQKENAAGGDPAAEEAA